MACIRIIVSTYRRAHLLPRALASLVAQTFTDWICEVHNDAPDDPEPARIVAKLGHPHIRCINHGQTLGLTAVLNLLFEPGNETYGALLEDDNWWDPTLLTRLVETLEAHPEAELAWANMRCWREETDGSWTRLEKTIWPITPNPGIRLFSWPVPRQVLGHLYSNGAALCRLHRRSCHRLPPSTIPGSTEALRERSFASPLLFIEEPLGHFALTLATAQPLRSPRFFIQQVLLAASFFRHVAPPRPFMEEVWRDARKGPARAIHVMLVGACVARRLRWAGPALLGDWAWFLAWMIRHPCDAWRGLTARTQAPEIWDYVNRHTGEAAAAASPFLSDHAPSR